MSYSTDAQVLAKIGNIKIAASGILIPSMRLFASNQIDIRIRQLYVTPVVSTDLADMQYLQDIEANYSAGVLLQDIATQHSLKEISVTGKVLEQRAMKAIDKLVAGNPVLIGAIPNPNAANTEVFSTIILNTPDKTAYFDRPISGIENDAIKGNYDAKQYNAVEDVLNEDDPFPPHGKR